LHRRSTVLAILSLTSLLFLGSPAARAQTADAPPAITSLSQLLRAVGYDLSAAETAFFDADEQVQAAFAQSLAYVELLSAVDPAQRNDEWRQELVATLTRIVSLDPTASPQAPAHLERLRELAIAQRTHFWRAARQWLDAVQADDPDWVQRGVDEYRAGLQQMANWHQELLARYPPPQGQP
jgi:hypothetical protein